MTDGGRSLAGKYSIEGVCDNEHIQGRHNTVPGPARVVQHQDSNVACSSQPAASQSPGVITESWTTLLLTGTK